MAFGVIFSSFFAALGQLGDPRFRRVLLLGLVLTVALLVGVYAAFLGFLQWSVGEEATLPLVGQVTWLKDLLTWSSLGVMLILSVFLMVPVASAITSMFLEDVAEAVEAVHYPSLPPADRTPLGDAITDTIGFLGVIIVANLMALVLYAFFAPFALFIFWGMNGFLLGREYFTLAAMRRVGRAGAKELRQKHFLTIWVAGILMAMPLSIPLVNL